MYKKFKAVLVIFSIFFINPAFSMSEEELKQYTYIDFYSFISSYNARNINLVKGAYEEK